MPGLIEDNPLLDRSQWRGGPPVRQLTNKSEYHPLGMFGADVVRHARPVAYIRGSEGLGGTGFLVAPDLLLTNQHILRTADDANKCTVWFNFNDGIAGDPEDSGADRYTCSATEPDGLFYSSPYRQAGVDAHNLDFALVRIKTPQPPGDKWGYVPVVPDPYCAYNIPLTVIQHPQHQPTWVGQGDGQVKHRDSLVVQYVTDTDSGSSGAPVLNKFWQLVALHHGFFNFQRGDVLDNGFVLPSAMKGNEGINIKAILDEVQRQYEARLKAGGPTLIPAAHSDGDGNLIWP